MNDYDVFNVLVWEIVKVRMCRSTAALFSATFEAGLKDSCYTRKA